MESVAQPRRTGLIVFSSRMVSVFTGMIFLVMITRWLSPDQFGLWEFILDLVVFSSFPVGLFTYWATREVARGAMIGRTTQVLSLLLSAAGVALYLVLTYGTYSWIGSPLTPFLLGLALVPLSFWVLSTQAVVVGHNPTIGGYATIVSELAKLAVAYPMLYIYHMGIEAVIIAIGLSYFVQAGISTILLGKARGGPVQLAKGREWLKEYHVPALFALTNVLVIADTFVASIGQGGTTMAGFYQAAFQVGSVVSYSTSLSVALYPLLLRGHSERLPGQVLEFSLLFGAPMAAGVMVLAPKILSLLKPTYVSSSGALVLISLVGVAGLVSSVIDASLMGREEADLSKEDRRRRIFSSNLLFVPVANMGYSVFYLASVLILGRLSVGSSIPVYQYATYWALSQLILTCCLVAYKMRRLLKRTPLLLTRSIVYFAVSSFVMGVVLLLVSPGFLPPSLDSVEYGLRLVVLVLVGGAVYFGVLLSLDRRTRDMARVVLSTIVKP